MCPGESGPLKFGEQRNLCPESFASWELGYRGSGGTPGQPSPLMPDGGRPVQIHGGVAIIRRNGLEVFPDQLPATFCVWKRDGLGVYMLTASSILTEAQWQLLNRLLTIPGATDTVGVDFKPTTQNLEPLITAQST